MVQNQKAAPGVPAEFDLITAWRTVRKYWATTLATAIVVIVGVVFFTLGQTKLYRATATLQFDPNPPRPLGKGVDSIVELGAGDYWDNHEYYETQYKIIQSQNVASAVVRRLGLNRNIPFLRRLPEGATAHGEEVSVDDAAELLRTRLTVTPVRDSRLASVEFTDADPVRAQDILSTLVDAYLEQNLDNALSSTNTAVEWLETQLDKLKRDLDSNEHSLHEFKFHNNILSVAFDDQSNMLREEMHQLSEALTTVRTKIEEVSARSRELQTVSADDPSTLPAAQLLESGLLQTLRQRYEEARRDMASLLSEGRGRNHPEVLSAASKVETTRGALLSEVRNIQGAMSSDLAALRTQQVGLSSMLERAKRSALDLNLLEIEYNRLRRSKENTEKLYQMVLERTKESELTRMMRVNNLRIVDRPRLPKAPVVPRVGLNLSLGVIGGFLLGIAAAVSRTMFDRTLKTPEDTERDLGVTCLGLIPEIESAQGAGYFSRRSRQARSRSRKPILNPELIVDEQPGSAVAEAARAVRTNLMFTSPDKPYRVLLVSSAGPSEGKTTVACCIAIAMAQAGQRVLLVDCDLRRPRVHRIFGLNPNKGLTTALLGEADEQTVSGTSIENLFALPAGPIPPNPAELLHSERFAQLLTELKGRFDRVIIDSPPLVAVTDATVLSNLVDGTILVVRAFATSKDIARHGVKSINDVGANIAGFVLNAVNFSRPEYKYYQYYKRSYYSDGKDGGTTKGNDSRQNEDAGRDARA